MALCFLVASYLRFTNLNWDEGVWIHPDEAHMQRILSVIRLPDDWSVYFDTHASPLNERNSGERYSYGTLPMFLTRWIAEELDRGCGEPVGGWRQRVAAWIADGIGVPCESGVFTGTRGKQVGRMLSALADLGTVGLVYLIGRRLYGRAAGILGAALATLTAFSIQQAHFFTVDSMACFFTLLVAYFSVQAAQTGRWTRFGLAGLAVGMAMACKISAATAALLVPLAAGEWVWSSAQGSRKKLWKATIWLALAGVLAFVAFRVFQPYAFEGPGFFGLRPSPEWLERLAQIRDEQAGVLDYPSGRQWTDRAPILFPLKDMVFWGMGLPFGLAAWAAWAVAGVELWRGKRIHLVLWGWTTAVFLYHGTRWVKTMRSFLPLYPLFAILTAFMLIKLCRASSRWRRRIGYALAALVVVGTLMWAWAVFSIYLREHPRLAASRWIYAHIPAGSTLANEHWDWGPPLPVDGYNPGAMYNGFEMALYDEDTWEKKARLFDWLDQADYIIIGSNRLYASIARLPARYPLAIAYYRALFAGRLGFELVADFSSYPALGPLLFPDQEEPFPLLEGQAYVHQRGKALIVFPPADEAFSVYDHPRVLIFRKTAFYSRQLVESELGGVDLSQALNGFSPQAATLAPNALEIDAETWADQQAGGTWAEMFDRDALLNRHPVLAAIAWWAVVSLLGWFAFPILFVALPRLRDRGYGLARVLGLLAIAYLTWLAASLRMAPNTRETIVRATLFLALVGGGVGWLKRTELRRFVRRNWRVIIWTEGLFALLYVSWIGVRLLNPDLWHPYVGGEKPMDFAYLNAVIKSTWFPPYNPWFSGSTINYYYFGFVIVGVLIKLIGTLPAIAYNLAVPLLFALTGVGAFSAGYNFFGGRLRGALLAGGLALTFMILLGNLGVLRLIIYGLGELDRRTGGVLFPSTIHGFPEAVSVLRGLYKLVFTPAEFPISPGSSTWYWDPTRIIPIGDGEFVTPITEFPAFTFLYADLHAHMIAFILVVLVLAVIIHWARSPRPGWPSLLLGGLVIGALRPTNTWDYPTYLALGVAALAVGAWSRQESPWAKRLKTFSGRAVLVVVLSVVFYLPYLRHYAAGYTSLAVWTGSRTPAGIYLLIHGVLLFPLLTCAGVETARLFKTIGAPWSPALVMVLGGVILTAGLVILGLVSAILTLLEAQGLPTLDAMLEALRPPPVGYIALPVAALAAWFVLARGMPPGRRLLWLMVGLAMALSVAVEIVVLAGDIERMNTVFKFYLQVWILLAVAAGVSAAWIIERIKDWRPEWRWLWGIGMGALIFAGALFLPFGLRSRAIDRMSADRMPPGVTLDGMAFMDYSVVLEGAWGRVQEIPLRGDALAIRWLQDQVPGSPVIMEGLAPREYLWGGRVSVYTGLPAVIGWRWHQIQQRVILPSSQVDRRIADVNECYNTLDAERAYEILGHYGVRYVYVGQYERAYYDASGLLKFDQMVDRGLLRVAYDQEGVRIYEVVSEVP